MWACPGPWYSLRLSYVFVKGKEMGLSLTFGVKGMSSQLGKHDSSQVGLGSAMSIFESLSLFAQFYN